MLELGLILSAVAPVTLYEVPASFSSMCPIVTFAVRGNDGKTEPRQFAIDSGIANSFLLTDNGTGLVSATSLAVPGVSGQALGVERFSQVKPESFNKEFVQIYKDHGVTGTLGGDFLATHDVLIDFKAHRIFISGLLGSGTVHGQDDAFSVVLASSSDGPTAPNGALPVGKLDLQQAMDMNLIMVDKRPHVLTYVKQRPKMYWLMMLDTWTSTSLLPGAQTTGLASTGVKRKVVGINKTFEMTEQEADIRFNNLPDQHVHILSGDQKRPILGINTFAGESLLLQLRERVARVWMGSAVVAAATPNQ